MQPIVGDETLMRPWVILAAATLLLLVAAIALLVQSRSTVARGAGSYEPRSSTSALPPASLPQAEAEALPQALLEQARGWSPEPTHFEQPPAGEEAPIRVTALEADKPPPPSPPPNPFVPSKQHLTADDIRAGTN